MPLTGNKYMRTYFLQGSVERANRDVEDILACWMRDNNTTEWADNLRCVQYLKNQRHHSGIGRTPFNAMFGEHRYSDQSGNVLPNDVWKGLESEEDLAVALGLSGSVVGAPNQNENDESSETESESVEEETEEESMEMDEGDEEAEAESTTLYGTDDILEAFRGPLDIVITQKCSVCDTLHGGLTKCFVCDTFCHSTPPCSRIEGSIVICQLCVKSDDMRNERTLALQKQQQQAQRMLSETAKRFRPAELGDNVLVPVPEVDRGRTDFRNISGVITTVGPDGTYTIGTSSGVLKQSYVRSQFIPTSASLVGITDVPTKSVSLREVAKSQSLTHGQGFVKCSCDTGCKNNKCSCRGNGKLCNSKCHKSHATCTNK